MTTRYIKIEIENADALYEALGDLVDTHGLSYYTLVVDGVAQSMGDAHLDPEEREAEAVAAALHRARHCFVVVVTFGFDYVEGEGGEPLHGDVALAAWLAEFKLNADRWPNLDRFEVVATTREGEKQRVTVRLDLRDVGAAYVRSQLEAHILHPGLSGDILSLSMRGAE